MNNENDLVLCWIHVLSAPWLALRLLYFFFNTVSGIPPCWVVLCLISCFSLKSTQSLPSLFFTFPPSIFPPFPILSSHSSPLFSSLPLPHLSVPSSSIHPLPFFSPLLCPYHLSDCLLMPSFLLLSSLNPSSSSSSSSHAAHCCSVYPCITVTTLPAPAVKLFLGELTCECRATLRRKEKIAKRVMGKI